MERERNMAGEGERGRKIGSSAADWFPRSYGGNALLNALLLLWGESGVGEREVGGTVLLWFVWLVGLFSVITEEQYPRGGQPLCGPLL